MTESIVIIICVLLLIAYLFDLTSARTRIPSVILLLLLGWAAQQVLLLLRISLPGLSELLPVLGSLGLILIVLEGSLELELNASKVKMVKTSLAGAVVSLLALSALLAAGFCWMGEYSFKTALINAVPFGVISSAIAIPTARALRKQEREFVVYESSLSDIAGVLLFNFLAFNTVVTFYSVAAFGLELVIITIVSFVATLLLSYLLSKIDHHIKFIPIILLVVLIYETSKVFHLPGLLFILFFGLFLGNIDELSHFKWMQVFRPQALKQEVNKFKELTVEAAFLVRSIFFLLFGFLLQTSEILNQETFVWALAIVFFIYVVRALQLRFFGYSLIPLLFIAPRGLITILLFLSIVPEQSIPLVNKSLVIQVVLLTALMMMVGMMMAKPSNDEKAEQYH
jgi:Kef-type K+ transport system membrane component KefB